MAPGNGGATDMSSTQISRRQLVAGAAAAVGSLTSPSDAAQAPAEPVVVARCGSYEAAELLPTLEGIFDKLGGLGRLVKGKTVAIKLNFNPGPTIRLGHLPLGDTHWTNPKLVCATMSLMAKAGVHRIRLVEQSPTPVTHPLEETFLEANWDPQDFISAAPRVEFENTDYPGQGRKFVTISVPRWRTSFPGL